jgi:beta-glucosidase
VSVKNTGQYEGKETVQLYVRDLVGSVTRPVKELKGFQQVVLSPGQSQTVRFELTAEDLKFYTRNMEWTYEPGEFDLFVGPHSAISNAVRVELTKK